MPRRACARGVTPDRAFEFGLKPRTVRGRSFLPEGPTLSKVPKVFLVPEGPTLSKVPKVSLVPEGPTVFEHAAACQLRSWMIAGWEGRVLFLIFLTIKHFRTRRGSHALDATAMKHSLG